MSVTARAIPICTVAKILPQLARRPSETKNAVNLAVMPPRSEGSPDAYEEILRYAQDDG